MKTNIIISKAVITLIKKVIASWEAKKQQAIEDDIKAAAAINYNAMTAEEIKKTLRSAFCTDHTGKMKGVWSISTSCMVNSRCLARMLDGATICAHCFSAAMNGRYSALRAKLIRNTFMLTTVELTAEMIPDINCKSKMFRFESFGDLLTPLQVKNYFTIANKAAEKNVACALWTKNPDIIAKAIEMYGLEKPANLQIILSTLKLNDTPADASKYPFIDKVFTVYDHETAAAEGININCGARSCATCRRCYTPCEGVEKVNELLK